MSVQLAQNNYGKSGIRLVRVTRQGKRHDLKDITVDIQFAGDFEAVHTRGDNSNILPTDTLKNTVYALAAQKPVGEIEEFAQRLIAHFLAGNPQVTEIRIRIRERMWGRLPIAGKPHPSAFIGGNSERRSARVVGTRKKTSIQAGIEDLLVLRTAGSGFSGYIKDAYTTLPETSDRIFATVVKAEWSYKKIDIDFNKNWNSVHHTLLETFASHMSKSVQHTLYAMGEAALKRCSDVTEIRLSMPNKHHLAFDLTRLGLANRNEVFIPTDEPFGLIEATVRGK